MAFPTVYIFGVFMGVAFGLYCLMAKTNLIKSIIGIEIMAKSVFLAFILGGYHTNQSGLGQSFVITMIFIDAIVVAVALALIVNAFKHTGSIDVSSLKRLRG